MIFPYTGQRMLIATHGPECHEYVVNFLKQNNYNIEFLILTALRVTQK